MESYPYLALAREIGVSYGTVLLAADFSGLRDRRQIAAVAWRSLDDEQQQWLCETARRERARQIEVERGWNKEKAT